MKLSVALGLMAATTIGIVIMSELLVWISVLLGNPMTLVFNSYELAGLIGAALIAVLISVDGESNWLEGAQLLALYLMLGISFYFVG